MAVIGITGGISTGKSTLCACLREIVPTAKFFDADHGLNREKLRHIVFGNAAKKRALEQILHPRIRRQWSTEAETHRNSPDFFFADIPLLYETGGERLCDRVVVVACSYRTQLRWLMERMSLERSATEQMINSQMPLKEKIGRADHVVWNNAARMVLADQARCLVALWQKQSWTKT